MRFKLLTCLAFLSFFQVFAQNFTIEGIVNDESDFPIIGATVVLEEKSKGTITDFDGKFVLNDVTQGDIITFSYVGYKTQKITITDSNSIDITLQEDLAQLDEVVVIGYGTQSKKEITGAVSVIDSKTIDALKPIRIEQALQGQVAGVNVSTNSGSPGAASTISIRGISTNGDNRPLILVDGIVIEDLSTINPNDIQSLSVLKDASAGIYGVRAANGVILVTTKTGKKDQPLSVEYNSYMGVQQTTRKLPVLNAVEYAALVNEAYAAAGNNPQFNNLSNLGYGTDWQDAVFTNAFIGESNIRASGGTEKATYSVSGSFLTQDGIVGGSKSNFRRSTTNANFNYDILDNLKLKTGLFVTGSRKRNLVENAYGSVLFNAVNMAPTFNIRDANGNYTKADGLGAEVINPLAQIENTHNTTEVFKLSGNVGLNYEFLKGFSAEANYQFNYSEVDARVFNPLLDYGAGKVFNVEENSLFEGLDYYRDYTFDAFLKYNTSIADSHNISALLGTSIYRTMGEFTGMTGRNLSTNDSNEASLTLATEFENINERTSGINPTFDSRLLSYFARIQYDYKKKYLFSGVIRRDGSSNFGPKNKFGVFPTASVGWAVSEEGFFNREGFANELKIRSSYGLIGNDRIGAFRFISLLDGEGTYIFNDEEQFGAASSGIANPEIKWETQRTFNLGVDAKFFDYKLNVTADYFSRRTDDLLISPEVSGLLGAAVPPYINGGSVKNDGFEFVIGYNDNFSDNLKFGVSYNLTYLHNEVMEVPGQIGYEVGGEFGISQPEPSRMQAGLPIGYFYGYQTDGVFQNQTEVDNSPVVNQNTLPGDLRYVDQNTDGVINEQDRVYIGDPIPEVTMGLNITLNYKKFDFSAYAFASIGNDIVRNYERNQQLTNRTVSFLNRWTGEGSTNSFPSVTTGATSNNLFSDFYVEDGSFVRLQNMQVGYTVMDASSSDRGVQKLRFYVSANNLFTLTKYSGFDPTASNGSPLGGGIDNGFYPSARMFLFGINFNFK